jgi:inosine-uridine nucleoside N-ribohydrolase
MTEESSEKELVIIDTDCGTDDASAVLLAIGCKKFNVLGITCIGGNTSLEQVCTNVLRVLKIGRREDIPVFRGCTANILDIEFKSESRAHSADGFGGIADSIQVDAAKIQSEHAINWLVKTVSENEGKVTLITLGPMTNILVAYTMYPEFQKKLKRLVIMGGTLDARGNCSLTSEFNVFCDPEAAHVILKSFTCPITMVTWNVCLESYLSWEWYQQKVLASNSIKANFIGRLFAKRNEWFKQIPAVFKGFMACDLLTIACLVDPEIILDKVKHYATVELNGLTTRGQLVVDWREFTNMPANVEFITKIDLKRLESLYESCLLR